MNTLHRFRPRLLRNGIASLQKNATSSHSLSFQCRNASTNAPSPSRPHSIANAPKQRTAQTISSPSRTASPAPPSSHSRLANANANASASHTETHGPVFSSSINPPTSTLPPPLDLPLRTPSQSKPAHLLATGKAYWKFYKTGVKQTWANMKAARALRRRKHLPFRSHSKLIRMLSEQRTRSLEAKNQASISGVRKLGAALEARPAKLTSDTVSADSVKTVVSTHDRGTRALSSLSRAEFQFLHREFGDTVRLPIFGVILLIFGEWTPALVLIFGNIVPKTCHIPRQVESALRKRHEARDERLERLSARSVPTTAVKETPRAAVAEVKRQQSAQQTKREVDPQSITYGLSYRLGTYSQMMDLFGLTSRRLTRRLAYLDADDALLLRDGGEKRIAKIIGELSRAELRIACDERGIEVLRKTGQRDDKGKKIWEDVPVERLREQLRDWLHVGGWRDVLISPESATQIPKKKKHV